MAEVTREEEDGALTFNAWHETLILSPLDSHLLPLLDGTRDRRALLEALLAIDHDSPIDLERNSVPAPGTAERRAALEEYIEALPHHLAELKLVRIS